jgi:mRNA-degrading endonuclease RelE of RelBE toxin-antitoxin system
VLIVETSVFTRRVSELLSADSYRALQVELVGDPRRGRVIRGSGGLRKLRWQGAGRGRRGGTRVVYYWAAAQETILLLLIYPKAEQEDLTRDQLQVLKRVVQEAFP